jgi:CubicO group peptidase (beta-lactamase class C family)
MSRLTLHLCRLFLLLALALPAGARADTSPELSELLQDINAIRRDYKVPGVAFTLVSPQALLWSGGIGYADLATRQPAAPDTLYQIDALSRTVTALATLLAAERDRLSLDDRLQALAPETGLHNPWEETHPVRIAHLLEQTAGLLDAHPGETGKPPQQCHWPPGLYASRSSAGTGLAIAALQAVIDEPYAAFVRRRLFTPLGMQQTRVALDPQTQTSLASGYDADGRTLIPPQPSRAAIASPREVATLLQLLLARGRYADRVVLDATAMQRLETPRTTLAAWQGLEYGYGLGNDQSLHRGFLLHGQDGAAGGHLSRYAYSHALGLGYLVVINARQPAALAELRLRIEDYLVEGQTPAQPPVADLDSQQLRRLSGRYQALTWRFPAADAQAGLERNRVEVRVSGGGLEVHTAQGQQRRLLPVSAQLFRRADQPLATSAFVEYGDDVYLLGEFGNYLRVPETRGTAAQR